MDGDENVSGAIPEGTNPIRRKKRKGDEKSWAEVDRDKEERANALRHRQGPDTDNNMHDQ